MGTLLHPQNRSNVTVLILAFNEQRHIERSIQSAYRITRNVVVVDSSSSDRTVEIALALGAEVAFSPAKSFSEKLNWALRELPIQSPWTIRLDADEIFTDTFVEEIGALLGSQSDSVTGIWVRRQIWFMGRWIRRGGMYPVYALRIWRTGLASCRNQVIDEYMMLHKGTSLAAPIDIIDCPNISLTQWVDKHNRYSDIEAAFRTEIRNSVSTTTTGGMAPELIERRVNFLKDGVYYRAPILARPVLLFVYKYFLRLGFLDGKEGLIWHVLHTFWYRFLIDVKILEKRYGR